MKVYLDIYGKLLKNSKNFLNKVALKMKEKKYGPEEIIYYPDAQGETLYFILKGCVDLYLPIKNPSQNEFPVVSNLKGESFGVYSFFSGRCREAGAISKHVTSVVMLQLNDFIHTIKEFESDYEIYCMMKDKVNLSRSTFGLDVQVINPQLYQQLNSFCNQKCKSCGKFNHQLYDCPLISYRPKKQLIIARYNKSNPQERSQGERRQLRSPNTLFILRYVGQLDPERIMKNMEERSQSSMTKADLFFAERKFTLSKQKGIDQGTESRDDISEEVQLMRSTSGQGINGWQNKYRRDRDLNSISNNQSIINNNNARQVSSINNQFSLNQEQQPMGETTFSKCMSQISNQNQFSPNLKIKKNQEYEDVPKQQYNHALSKQMRNSEEESPRKRNKNANSLLHLRKLQSQSNSLKNLMQEELEPNQQFQLNDDKLQGDLPSESATKFEGYLDQNIFSPLLYLDKFKNFIKYLPHNNLEKVLSRQRFLELRRMKTQNVSSNKLNSHHKDKTWNLSNVLKDVDRERKQRKTRLSLKQTNPLIYQYQSEKERESSYSSFENNKKIQIENINPSLKGIESVQSSYSQAISSRNSVHNGQVQQKISLKGENQTKSPLQKDMNMSFCPNAPQIIGKKKSQS